MKLHHIEIHHFRGIKRLDWHMGGDIVCLVGSGDTTKTTVLDAVEYALAPQPNIVFSDSDFYEADLRSDIVIEVTVGDVPPELLSEEKYGFYQRGYNEGQETDDPEDGVASVLSIRLQISDDLEPQWTVVKDSNPEAKPIRWPDRERLGCVRLGEDASRHFSWGRGSALSKITDKKSSSGSALAMAHRAACQVIAEAPLDELASRAKAAGKAISEFGVKTSALRPGLDTRAFSLGVGTLSLHDGNIPLRAFGLGSRRLAALAVQQIGLGGGAIILIDEVEHGLEPHRIRQLLKRLCEKKAAKNGSESGQGQGQVIMTTHSPTTIMALSIKNLRFVRSDKGVTTVTRVDPDSIDRLQGIVRERPHALLGRKIIVCEGKTEEALCRVLDSHWSGRHGGEGFVFHGVVATNGGGRTSAPASAIEFSRIGYDVLFFGETDEPIDPEPKELVKHGVTLAIWPDNTSTEERIAMDLPLNSLQELLNAAIEEKGSDRVLNAISSVANLDVLSLGVELLDWMKKGISEETVRQAVGTAAKKTLKGWFKDIGTGEKLGEIVVKSLPLIGEKPFSKTVSIVEDWVYGHGNSAGPVRK